MCGKEVLSLLFHSCFLAPPGSSTFDKPKAISSERIGNGIMFDVLERIIRLKFGTGMLLLTPSLRKILGRFTALLGTFQVLFPIRRLDFKSPHILSDSLVLHC